MLVVPGHELLDVETKPALCLHFTRGISSCVTKRGGREKGKGGGGVFLGLAVPAASSFTEAGSGSG